MGVHIPSKRPLCNELVCEFCSAIPIVNTWERILLTSTNIHTYLGPRFRKMRLIYRDAIAFLKAKLKVNKDIKIQIDEVAQNKEGEPIVVINQEQWDGIFLLQTNHFRVHIRNTKYHQNLVHFPDNDAPQVGCAQLFYFLRLIAALLQPIHLDLYCSQKECLVRFLNALSGCIDSIGLSPKQFNSTLANEALGKFNKLEISAYDPVNVHKLVRWLTTPTNNSTTNGQSKKYLTHWGHRIAEAIPLLDEMKKDFVLSTSQSSFVVRLKVFEPLDEFTLCNEWTGEKLQLCRRNIEDEWHIHVISRFSNNQMDNIVGDFAEFNPHQMTTILF